MEQAHRALARRGLPAAAAGTLMIVLAGGPAASAEGDAEAAAPPTVTMHFERGSFFFEGPRQVRAGQRLRIRNDSSPRRGGPHTFTLVKRRLQPKTRRAQRNCFNPGRICRRGARAHEADLDTGAVSRPLVRAGGPGWNRAFTLRREGDSWYTETEGETFSQLVSARAGRTLFYLCIIHPEMQGKIRVVGRR